MAEERTAVRANSLARYLDVVVFLQQRCNVLAGVGRAVAESPSRPSSPARGNAYLCE